MRFVINQDAEGLFRWILYAGEGPSIAAGIKAYSTKAECFEDILKVRRSADTEVDDQTLVQGRR